MSLKAKLDWFSIVYVYSKNGLKQNEIMTQYLNKLISYLNYYSRPSLVQGTLNGAYLWMQFIWFQRDFRMERESWKCKFLNSKPMSELQLDEARIGRFSCS